MPANPPAIFTPPGVPSPSVPGGVHAVPSASPSVPGAVHVVPSPAGADSITISNTGTGSGQYGADGTVILVPSLHSGKQIWTTTGQTLDELYVAEIAFRAVYYSAGAWRVVLRSVWGYPYLYEAYCITTSDSPLGLTYEMTLDSIGGPPTLTASGALPTPPAIVTGAPSATPATPGAIHSAPAASPGTPPVITP